MIPGCNAHVIDKIRFLVLRFTRGLGVQRFLKLPSNRYTTDYVIEPQIQQRMRQDYRQPDWCLLPDISEQFPYNRDFLPESFVCKTVLYVPHLSSAAQLWSWHDEPTAASQAQSPPEL